MDRVGVLVAAGDLPERGLLAVAGPVRLAGLLHSSNSRFMLPMIVAAAEHQPLLGPDDLRAHASRRPPGSGHRRRMQRAVPDVGHVAGNSAQASRQSARSSFTPCRPPGPAAPAWLRQTGSYSTPYGGSRIIKSGVTLLSTRSTSVATVPSPQSSSGPSNQRSPGG